MNSISYIEKASEAATANGEAFKSMFEISLGATQKLFELNGELVRSFVQRDGSSSGDFDFRNQIDLHKRHLERTSEYLRDINDICLSTQAEITKLNTQRADIVMKTLSTQLDELAKTNPLDATGFSEMLKSTFAKTGTTYEEMINTARELTESSLTAAMTVLQPAARETGRKAASPKKAA